MLISNEFEDTDKAVEVDSYKARATIIASPLTAQEENLDSSILKALPQGHHVVAWTPHSTSLWTETSKLDTVGDDCHRTSFFLKTSHGKLGETMFRGEFEGMSIIHKTVPESAPKPIAWGQCEESPAMFFFLCEYLDMDDGVPEISAFCDAVARLHENAVSPNGKFGFHVVTCNGNIPQLDDWESSWEDFFSKGLKHMLRIYAENHGERSEVVTAARPILEVVIPRLLRPLQQGRRSIVPVLVHGDLWCGNASTNKVTGKPVLYDCAAFYAHNEYELGNWRPSRNSFTEALSMYRTKYQVAEPKADFEDRVRLYEIRFNMHAAIMFPDAKEFPCLLLESMRWLSDKYCLTETQPWSPVQVTNTAPESSAYLQ